MSKQVIATITVCDCHVINKQADEIMQGWGRAVPADREPVGGDAMTTPATAREEWIAALKQAANETCDHGSMLYCPRDKARDILFRLGVDYNA